MSRSNVYFMWDPVECEFEIYDSREAAINAAECVLQLARGRTTESQRWPINMLDLCIGKVELIATELDGDPDTNNRDYALRELSI